MTLIDTTKLFKSWNVSPPTNLMVKAILEGLGGGVKMNEVSETETASYSPGITDAQLTKLSLEAGRNLPIVAKDPGLPQQKPIFNVEEMRQKNREVIKRNALAQKG